MIINGGYPGGDICLAAIAWSKIYLIKNRGLVFIILYWKEIDFFYLIL